MDRSQLTDALSLLGSARYADVRYTATHQQHEHSAFARWGRKVSGNPWPWGLAAVLVLVVLAIPLFSISLGQPDNGTNPTSRIVGLSYLVWHPGGAPDGRLAVSLRKPAVK